MSTTLSRQGQFKPQKTKLCSFFKAAKCSRGVNCKFAHCEGELELAPDLTKTSICLAWKAGTCSDATLCRFAHGKHDLRYDHLKEIKDIPRHDHSSPYPKQVHHGDDGLAGASMPPPGMGRTVDLDPWKVVLPSALHNPTAQMRMPSFTGGIGGAAALNHLWEADTVAGETSSDDDGSLSSAHWHYGASLYPPWHAQQLVMQEQDLFGGYMAAMELTMPNELPFFKQGPNGTGAGYGPPGSIVPMPNLFGSCSRSSPVKADIGTADRASATQLLAHEDDYSVFSGTSWLEHASQRLALDENGEAGVLSC